MEVLTTIGEGQLQSDLIPCSEEPVLCSQIYSEAKLHVIHAFATLHTHIFV